VFLGRGKVLPGGETATVGLLLEERHNPPDPFHAGQQKRGFSSERFALLEELTPKKIEEETTIKLGLYHNPGVN
jgi:hypothetical protein